MTSKVFNVSDYYELLALHRALLESQFCEEPNDLDVSASPIVAKLHKKLLDILVEVESERKGFSVENSWGDWLKIHSGRREWKVALKRAKSQEFWGEWDYSTKKEYVYDLLSPFELDDDLVDEFIVQASDASAQ